MTAASIAHHELADALATRDRHAGLVQLARMARHPANLGSAALLAGELVATRVGPRRDDPGLSLRLTARALARATRPRSGSGSGSGSRKGR